MSDLSANCDVLFLHAPLSFEKIRYPLGGIFESSTGTSDILTMCPVGLSAMTNRLRQQGLSAKVVNVGKMLQKERDSGQYDTLSVVRSLQSHLFGVSLHWSAHAAGAIDLARYLKDENPEALVFLGGLSSTFYAEELLQRYPFVDFVMLGECDEAIVKLVKAGPELSPGEGLGAVFDRIGLTNVAFRRAGRVERKPIVVPTDLTGIDYFAHPGTYEPPLDATEVERESVISLIPIVRGCHRNCRFCGGSDHAYREHFARPQPAMLPIPEVIRFIENAVAAGAGVIKLSGDTLIAGHEYNDALLRAIAQSGIETSFMLDLYELKDIEYLKQWKNVSRKLYIVFSPESSFQDIREVHAKRYTNDQMIRLVDDCYSVGAEVIYCTMFPLPGHTTDRMLAEIDFLDQLVARYPNICLMYQPYLYMDPASDIYDNEAQHGFRIRFRSITTIAESLKRAHWYYAIGYDFGDLDRRAFADLILEIFLRKAKMYFKHRKLTANDVLRTAENVRCNRAIIDYIEANPNVDDPTLQAQIEQVFPPYCRQSNVSPLSKAFFNLVKKRRVFLEEVFGDAFAYTNEILLRTGIITPEDLNTRYAAAMPSLVAAIRSKETSDRLASTFFQCLLSDLGLQSDFLGDLVRFEWMVYVASLLRGRLGMTDLPATEGVQSRFDFTNVCSLVERVRLDGKILTLPKEDNLSVYTIDPADGKLRVQRDGQESSVTFPYGSRELYRMEAVVRQTIEDSSVGAQLKGNLASG